MKYEYDKIFHLSLHVLLLKYNLKHNRENLFLVVLDAPTCKASQKSLYGVARTESVNITCEVESDPKDVTFHWALNNSVESIELHNFTSEDTRSVLTFTPRTMLEFGAILCWGINSVGEQKDPCVVRIIPAGKYSFYSTFPFLSMTGIGVYDKLYRLYY